MTQQTKIEWTDFTVNFWEGCQKVGPGCDHCYAEARNVRFHGDNWGPGKPRRYVKGGIAKLRKINRQADKFHEEHSHWPRVFCSSLSDIFDNAVDPAWRAEAFKELTAATSTRPQLLTKRIGNVFQMIPPAWAMKWPDHIGLMITVVNQAEADRDIPKLLELGSRLKIPWIGLSMEPLLGPVDLTKIPDPSGLNHSYMDALKGKFWMPPEHVNWPTQARAVDGRLNVNLCNWINWVIVGGESGHQARPTHPDWIRSLRDQCEATGTPFLFKQWGEWLPWEPDSAPLWKRQDGKLEDGNILFPTDIDRNSRWSDGLIESHGFNQAVFQKVGKKRAGRLLDGREWSGVPK